jgi:hypothetical protein
MAPPGAIVPFVRSAERTQGWFFFMVSYPQQLLLLKAIKRSPKPATTMSVWMAVTAHIKHDTGEIIGTQQQLADAAEVPLAEVSRALGCLHRIGALVKRGRGRYFINPNVGWAGTLERRAQAASNVVPLVPR